MTTLHGSWILAGEYFFLWGETWRSRNVVKSVRQEDLPALHPYNTTQDELQGQLQTHWEDFPLTEGNWQTHTLPFPSQTLRKRVKPILSDHDIPNSKTVDLAPWHIEGYALPIPIAIELLQQLPLGLPTPETAFVGTDLRFWAQVYRWTLDLIARSKFLPGLVTTESGESLSVWQPLLDSRPDQNRFRSFCQTMPAVCLAYQADSTPQEVVLGYLNAILNTQVQQWSDSSLVTGKDNSVATWAQSLAGETVELDPDTVPRLTKALENWTTPVQDYLVHPLTHQLGENPYRLCLCLTPPTDGEMNWGHSDWKLNYALQAVDDADFLIDADTIWQNPVDELDFQGRTIEQPQEVFLKTLGLAARLYSPIAASLETDLPTHSVLDPIEVYEFIRGRVWQLQNSGFGVILPPGLEQGDEKRLGIKVKANVSQQKNERLGLKSLLNYKLELAVGDKRLSKAEFERLLAQKSPLVKVKDEWMALQPADVKAAQEILATQSEETLSVEDAVRLSQGEERVFAKLPIVDFQTEGMLRDLIDTLNNNQTLQPIETPQEFQGELRPYQARGVGWLSFLEKWSLGACLADDMGLGKCITPESLVFVNGDLRTAESLWNNNPSEAIFDGEGFWKVQSDLLVVNAIDETTGKITQAPIQKLYRQQVREKLQKITLKDGSSITITKRHKLLTNQGWKNQLAVGDSVCVPSHLHWQGTAQDQDLVKVLAWQIAEGYEQTKRATVTITQKDVSLLEDLRLTLQEIGKRYNLSLNQAKVRAYADRTPALWVNSRDYQEFLEARGYQWGNRSADKVIPAFIMQSNLETVRVFLSHYFTAEGSVSTKIRNVEISSASPILLQQVSTLLRRLGIWLRICEKYKCASNGTGIKRPYYIGTLGGESARRFFNEIGFQQTEKQQKLAEICRCVSNTNVEGIPASDLVANIVQSTGLPLRHLGMHNTVYINGSQQFSRLSLEKVIQNLDKVISGEALQVYSQLKPSRWTDQTLAKYQSLDYQKLTQTRQQLQSLLNQEVFFCPIESIEEIDYQGWVYDFEVSQHHNFVANNILCHNTIQMIAFLLHLREEDEINQPTLLICPTSVLTNWEREVKRFAPTLSAIVHHGDKRKKGKTFAKAVEKKDLVITSYPLVYRDLDTLKTVDWQGVVLDEAQNIKNPQAKQSQAVRQFNPGFRIALTGTPVENRLSELWSILDFLNPNYLGNKQFFQRRFAIPIEKYGDRASLQTLRSLVQPFILRRLKTDKDIIQDLPEKQEMNVFCGLSSEQAALYQNLVEDSLRKIEESEGIKRRGLVLTLLLRLKQVCNHPAQYLKEKNLEAANRSGKLLRLVEMLEEVIEERDRALIFTQFAEWGKLLQPYLEKRLGVETLFLYGSTSKNQREEMIDRFQNDPDAPPILILSLKAGGTGLNLTRANHVFHVDRWWNPAVENQATDRAFRIGQTRNVQVHKFVCTGTLEERIHEMIESKKQLAEQTVDAGEQWVTELDTDQLRNLLLLDREAIMED